MSVPTVAPIGPSQEPYDPTGPLDLLASDLQRTLVLSELLYQCLGLGNAFRSPHADGVVDQLHVLADQISENISDAHNRLSHTISVIKQRPRGAAA